MMNTLQIPAMRGAMGDWVYYVTLLPFREVCARIKKTDEVHSSTLLREMIQRALTPRSKKIAAYLHSQPQRFFNAIVVGVYDGEPQWHRLSVKKSDLFDPGQMDSRVGESLGILTLRGDEKLFAVDGQHRVEGIKEFVRELGPRKASAIEDEICAIFVAHGKTTKGVQRTRRLFATLNRYAKPVSITEIIALDEDDVVAIACRDLLENHPLFRDGRVSLEKRKSLSSHDKTSFTSLVALYQAVDIYLMQGKREAWLAYKTVRPVEDDITRATSRVHAFWDSLVQLIPELKKVQDLDPKKPLPKSYRSEAGGDLLFRPIAPPMVAKCLRRAQDLGMDEKVFLSRFAKVPRALGKAPWLGVLWDGSNMITSEKSQQAAEKLILWMVNCDPDERKIKEDDIQQRLSALLNRPADRCVLPDKVD